MKTIVLKKSDLDKMPTDTQNQILNVVNTRETNLSELKKRFKALSANFISYRDDTNEITEIMLDEYTSILFVKVWHKTAGEQWGAGLVFEFRIGTKYARVDVDHFSSDHNGQNDWTEEIEVSEKKLEEIIDLLEEAERNEDKIDKDKIYKIAINRISSLSESYRY